LLLLILIGIFLFFNLPNMLNRKFQKIFIPEEIRVVLSVRPVRRAGFMLLDILIAIAVIGILASIVFVLFNDHQVAARNVLREDALASLRSGLENYYKANGVYPIETSWCVSGIKDNSDRYYCSNLFLGLKDAVSGNVLDPLFPKNFKSGCRYGYYYRSTQDGKGYELAARLERYSSMAKGNNFLYVSSASPKGAEISFLSDVVDLCSRSASVGGFVSQKNSDSSLFVNYPSAQSGFSDPAEFIYATPFFSFINEQSQAAAAVQIQLSEDNYNTLIWDSGDIAIASTASGQRTPDIFYGSGNPPSGILEAGKNYKWRARVKTADYSDWSSDATISMAPSGELMIARFYSGSGTGYAGSSAFSWATARKPLKGSGNSFSSSQFRVGTGYDGTYSIERGFAPVDTSKIPDDALIASAVFVFSGSGNAGGTVCGWGGNNKANLVLTAQTDPLALATSDFGKCGALDDPKLGSDQGIAFSSGSGQNYALTLNGSGRSWISKTGWTLLGLRSANDIGNQNCSKYYNNNIYSNSFNIIDNKPYLETAYASESSGGQVPASFSPSFLFTGYPSAQSGGQASVDFAFSTPFFSFAVNQADPAGAVDVQIQLAEYSYSDPVWDSGDIAIASTASGQRTPDIFYGSGNPPSGILEAGKNYKWRARVKISSDPEKYSPWSPDANIVMFNGDLTARFYSTGDGAIKQSAGPASQANWKIAHDGQDPIVSSSTAQEKIGTAYSKDAVVIQRGFFPFDSSKLPDNASIIGGSLNVWVDNKESKGDDGKNWVAVVQSFQEDGGRLTPGDYQNCGSDNGSAGRAKYTPVQEGSGRVDIADIPEDSDHNVDKYVNWALNEGGIGWISKIGMTKFGLREGHDVLDYRNRNGYFPSTNIGCNFSENADQSGDPYLEVNYK